MSESHVIRFWLKLDGVGGHYNLTNYDFPLT